ncbi:alanine dehydrogenase [Faecalibacter rhinopitheci]|uniref:alanine dehydrogenase n=1 Tax=Faecalibacter rhinopitheci TaxID=2779678 RepID=A0A8J7G4G3_9FLAO|nr:alanine dehydrogenase [Faecalibacter rhinopitheci]MBF0596105.1 alanine dehydrogenase [Faecalibacter rhinopitheci]MBQ0147031.1 alanine dehydrogenase [Candidatus Onthonaster equi]
MEDHSIYTPFSHEDLIPQPECLEIPRKKERFSIGIPKETNNQEKRICLTPDAVEILVNCGHQISIESGAGIGANYTDAEYSEAGAEIVYNSQSIFEKPIILKVGPLTNEEIEWIKPNTFLVSSVPTYALNKKYFSELTKKRITAVGFEFIKDEQDQLPVLRLLSEIAGTTAVLVGSELMSTVNGGNGILMGGVTGVRPTEVVILGAGTVAENATRTALGLGASVRVFDDSLSRLRRLQQNIGQRISTSTIDPKELSKALRRCDLAIGALRGNSRTPCVVTEHMVENMKTGAVIIDISIDQGGCFETSEITTHDQPTFIKHDVIHYAVSNITSRVSRTSSKALSNFFLSYLLMIANEGGFTTVVKSDKTVRNGVYLYHGRVVKKNLSDWFDLPFHDINLLIV